MGVQETYSISCLKDFCARSDYLGDDEINYGEKGPSFDGYILFYQDGKSIIKGKEHKIPIQVKGKEFRKIPEADTISYPVDIKHLMNYKNNGGILYIVIAVKKDTMEKKMYGKILLPIDIETAMSARPNNKSSITFQLKHISDSDKLTDLCQFYIKNWPKQCVLISAENGLPYSKHDNIFISAIPNIRYRDLVVSIIKSDDVYWYSRESGIDLPLSVVYSVVSKEDKIIIEVGPDFSCIADVKQIFNKNETVTIINDCITFRYEDATDKITMSFSIREEVRFDYALQTAKILIEFYNNKTIKINGHDVFSNLDILSRILENDIFCKSNMVNFVRIISIGENVKKLGINMKFISLSDAMVSEVTIEALAVGIVDKKPVYLGTDAERGFSIQSIGTKKIYIRFTKLKDNSVEIFDIFSDDFDLGVMLHNETKTIQTNKWFLIQPEDLPVLLVDRNKMINEIRITNEIEEAMLTEYILQMICAYDISRSREDLLFAMRLVEVNRDSTPNLVNLLQVKHRLGILNKEDEKLIFKLKATGDPVVMCCACILLAQYDEYAYAFSTLDKEKADQFCKWPIFTLAKKVFPELKQEIT